MADIFLFKPGEKAEHYDDVKDVRIANGVLTFCWRAHSGKSRGVKIKTTVPFVVQEEVGG